MTLKLWCVSELFVGCFNGRLARVLHIDAHHVGTGWVLCCEQLLFLTCPTPMTSPGEIASFPPAPSLLEGVLVKVHPMPLTKAWAWDQAKLPRPSQGQNPGSSRAPSVTARDAHMKTPECPVLSFPRPGSSAFLQFCELSMSSQRIPGLRHVGHSKFHVYSPGTLTTTPGHLRCLKPRRCTVQLRARLPAKVAHTLSHLTLIKNPTSEETEA